MFLNRLWKSWFGAYVDRRIAEALEKSRAETVADFNLLVNRAVDKTKEQMAALQAIDVGFRDRGHIIIVAHVGGKDVCHIVEMTPNMTCQEYMELSRRLAERYGVRNLRIDAGSSAGMMHDMYTDLLHRRH